MKIIHIVPSVADEASGPSYSVIRLCEALAELGHDVTLAALDPQPPDDPPACLRTFRAGLGPKRLGRSPAFKKWLLRRALSGSVDILHNHSLWMMPNIYPGEAARKSGVPLVVSPRGTLSEWAMKNGSPMKRLIWPLFQKRAISRAACFHATAPLERDDIRRRGFLQPVAVIPNGMDVPLRREKKGSGARTVLFLGRLHPKKGLDMLLPAWKLVHQRFPEWRLVIAGPDEGGHRRKMELLAKNLDLERLEFVGPLYGSDKTEAYHEAELFVLPTYSENFGLAVAEALAAGTPVIVTKGAPWGSLESSSAGWWVNIGVNPLAKALEDALSGSRETHRQMGVRGRSLIEREFSWKVVAGQVATTYQWLVSGGEKPPWVDDGR